MEKRDGQMRKPLDKIVVFIFAIILAGLLITPGPALCDAQEKPSLRTDIKRGLVIPNSEYSISPANLKVDKSRVTRLIQDSINEASEKHDFSKYSFMVIFMGARFREYGMIGLCGYPGMLG